MPMLLLLAALSPLPPELIEDARCVVAIARAAPTNAALGAPGRRYAAIVGADIMDVGGRTNLQARDVFADALKAPPADLGQCRARMTTRLTQDDLPEPVK